MLGSNVLATLGSAKTGNLRTVAGVVVGTTHQPITGTTCAFMLYRVRTAQGVVLVAGSRMRLA
jgi:hypothetical protein